MKYLNLRGSVSEPFTVKNMNELAHKLSKTNLFRSLHSIEKDSCDVIDDRDLSNPSPLMLTVPYSSNKDKFYAVTRNDKYLMTT